MICFMLTFINNFDVFIAKFLLLLQTILKKISRLNIEIGIKIVIIFLRWGR